mmetsp:Transcript_15546/g.39155  ORF Transcript_15546/g.39155 Transcript_15546/m.39155 type:complete len:249 (-) Transcript_15546:1449-2195(-)
MRWTVTTRKRAPRHPALGPFRAQAAPCPPMDHSAFMLPTPLKPSGTCTTPTPAWLCTSPAPSPFSTRWRARRASTSGSSSSRSSTIKRNARMWQARVPPASSRIRVGPPTTPTRSTKSASSARWTTTCSSPRPSARRPSASLRSQSASQCGAIPRRATIRSACRRSRPICARPTAGLPPSPTISCTTHSRSGASFSSASRSSPSLAGRARWPSLATVASMRMAPTQEAASPANTSFPRPSLTAKTGSQ